MENNTGTGANGREKAIVSAGILGVAANLLLVGFKAFVGFLSGSVAILTDAINNLSDALSSVITIVGAKLAAKAPDKGHPLGHGRIEYISSILIAVIILYAGVSAMADSIEKIITPDEPTYSTAAIVVIAASVAVKIALGLFFRRAGARTDSGALRASGTDAMYDSVVSSSILVSMAILYYFHVNIDGWLGAFIALFIIKGGIDALKDSGNLLIGERIPRNLSRTLKEEIEQFPGVLGAYDLILSPYGPELTIGSVHIQVPDWMSAHEIDTLSRRISTALYKEHSLLMTVGIYATNQSSPVAREMHATLDKCAAEHPEILQVHGFYVDENSKEVFFDVIVDFASENRRRVERQIRRQMQEKYPEYVFHTVLDRDISD